MTMLVSPMLLDIQFRARNVLKAIKGDALESKKDDDKDKKNAAVPEPPEDGSRTDPRVEDASPTREDLAAAKDKGGDDQDPDAMPEGDGPDGDGDEDEDEDGFDEFGHRDMDPRELKKAFPKIGHLFPDEAMEELEDNETIPGQTPKILGELMEAFRGMTDVLSGIKAEIERLKKGAETQGRELKKALDANESLESRLKDLHKTVPAAESPRAVSKAMGQGSEPQGFSTAELNTLAGSRSLSSLEIATLCLTGQRN